MMAVIIITTQSKPENIINILSKKSRQILFVLGFVNAKYIFTNYYKQASELLWFPKYYLTLIYLFKLKMTVELKNAMT